MNRTRSVMLRKMKRAHKHYDKIEHYLNHCIDKYAKDSREHEIQARFECYRIILKKARQHHREIEESL